MTSHLTDTIIEYIFYLGPHDLDAVLIEIIELLNKITKQNKYKLYTCVLQIDTNVSIYLVGSKVVFV